MLQKMLTVPNLKASMMKLNDDQIAIARILGISLLLWQIERLNLYTEESLGH